MLVVFDENDDDRGDDQNRRDDDGDQSQDSFSEFSTEGEEEDDGHDDHRDDHGKQIVFFRVFALIPFVILEMDFPEHNRRNRRSQIKKHNQAIGRFQ